MDYNDFEYLDKINRIESISLRLKEDLLDKAKSIAQTSNITLSEYLRSILEKDVELKKEKGNERAVKESFFLSLIQDSVVKFDYKKFPNRLFWFKNGKIIMENNNSTLYVHEKKLWDTFNNKFDINETNGELYINGRPEVAFIIKKVMTDSFHFKIDEPHPTWHYYEERWERVEKYFESENKFE